MAPGPGCILHFSILPSRLLFGVTAPQQSGGKSTAGLKHGYAQYPIGLPPPPSFLFLSSARSQIFPTDIPRDWRHPRSASVHSEFVCTCASLASVQEVRRKENYPSVCTNERRVGNEGKSLRATVYVREGKSLIFQSRDWRHPAQAKRGKSAAPGEGGKESLKGSKDRIARKWESGGAEGGGEKTYFLSFPSRLLLLKYETCVII